MAVPVWQSPVAGEPALAGHVNQLLAAHPAAFVYRGTVQASRAAGTGTVASSAAWYAQAFTTGSGQAQAGYVTLPCSVSGSPVPWALSLQADAGGQPSGTPLASVSYPVEFAGSLVMALLPCTVTPSSQYWIVAAQTGDTSDSFQWGKSAAASGALTSPDGATWSAAGYGLAYSVYDQSPGGPLVGITEDGGARFTLFGWSGSYGPSSARECTAGQTASGYAQSSRTWSYSGPLLTGVA